MLRFFRLLAPIVCLCWTTLLLAEEPASPLGRVIENFTLQDFRGQEHQLADLSDKKLVVIAFLGTECPLAKLYGPRLAELHQQYQDQGVGFLAINANQQDSITELAAYARIHQIPFPVLKDVGNHVADQMGAVRTPEVFLLDEHRKVRYWGRIDDQYGIGYVRDEPQKAELRIAIDELLAGHSVSTPRTAAVGCFIGRIQQPDPDSEVTYAGQIAHILQRRCVECHRTGEIAPFALTDYDEVAGWAETIAETVREGRMPPWHASPKYGSFANDRSMTQEEIELIQQWARAGAPRGDWTELPKPAEFVTGWQLPREPDLIVPMQEDPYPVPATGAVAYKYFTVDPGFTEDKWVRAAEAVPGNRAVVHHVLVMVKAPEDRRSPLVPATAANYLTVYVPGLRAEPYPEGMARLIPAGSRLIFQLHYTPIGSPQEDLSKVGLIFAERDEITHAVVTSGAWQRKLKIPPGESNYHSESTSPPVPAGAQLLAMMPHMHLRGKSFSYEARYPDGSTEMLLDVPHYDFNWQTSYRLSQPKLLPQGTRLHCQAVHDNSARNLANPDPTITVTWGDQTWEEMMIGYFEYALSLENVDTKQRTKVTAESRAKEIISRLDSNADGKIAFDEIPDKMRLIFFRVDADGDKFITREELEAGIRKLRPGS